MTDPAVHEITAAEEDSRQRLDMVLVRHLPHLSRSKIQSLVKSGRVTLRGEAIRSSEEVHAGDVFRVEEEVYKPPAGARAEDIARVRMPLGLDIGARSPMEIGVSIAAELIAWRAAHAALRTNTPTRAPHPSCTPNPPQPSPAEVEP